MKTYNITKDILIDVLQLALVNGQRSYVEENNVEISDGWKEKHMKEGNFWANKIKIKLSIDNTKLIYIDYKNAKIIESDKKFEENTYDNNYKSIKE